MRGSVRRTVACLLGLLVWAASSVATSATAGVPAFSQRSPGWSRQALGTDPVDTIGSAGCAMTAVAMVQAALGYTTNPGDLNRWLIRHGGYVDNDILLWRQAVGATRGAVRWRWAHIPGIVSQLRTDDQDINDLPSVRTVEAALDAGNLVVAEVRLYGGMHFVVLTGHAGATLFINDPWFGDRTTLQARYGPYGRAVRSAQIYYRGQAAASPLS
jgi:hypothetical protein